MSTLVVCASVELEKKKTLVVCAIVELEKENVARGGG